MDNSESESPLPDDYLPRHRDSALALVRPESSFLEFFKQSLLYTSKYCSDPNCCTFFDRSASSANRLGYTGNNKSSEILEDDGMPYPLALFEDLRELPSPVILLDLAQQGRVSFAHCVPFLSKISCMKLHQDHIPFHLLLPEALLGSSSLKNYEHQVSTKTLWHACVSLITGTVEVDNSIGRSLVWHTAAILIITFGLMQTDEQVWRQSEIVSGYVQSVCDHDTLYRPGFIVDPSMQKTTTMMNHNAIIQNESIHMLREFYFMVDTLRSIHFHTPTTVDSAWSVRLGPKAEYDFKAICEALVLDQRAPPATLSSDEYLLILTSILSDANTLLCMLGPLIGICTDIHEKIENASRGTQATHLPDSTTSFALTTLLNEDYYPPIPFTADYEYFRLRIRIVESLELWKSSFSSRTPSPTNEHTIGDSIIIPLFHFCRLLLECGPSIYITASLAGYMPHGYDTLASSLPRPYEPNLVGIHFSDSALQISIDILEAVEAASGSGLNALEQYCPLWYPLTLFYGALVAWARSSEEKTKQSTESPSRYSQFTSFRLLQMFHTELDKLKDDWGCAKQMALIVRGLM